MPSLNFNPLTPPENIVIESTYDYIFSLAEKYPSLPSGTMLSIDFQTKGRGQQGNSWHASKGLNLIPSFLVRYPHLAPEHGFRVSMLTALAIVDALRSLVPHPSLLAIKWPNDIYYNGAKIAGILIGHSIQGHFIQFSVVGIGLNVNEESFPAHIPHPTSLRLINHRVLNVDEVQSELLKKLALRLPLTENSLWTTSLLDEYCALLYQRGAWHNYRDLRSGEVFSGKIETVSEEGWLRILHSDGRLLSFAFKEISYQA